MKENKKQWVEPTLLVLVWNRPEEATLDTCKTMNNGGSGYEASDDGCHDWICFPCSGSGGS